MNDLRKYPSRVPTHVPCFTYANFESDRKKIILMIWYKLFDIHIRVESS